jgi:hypothetical protein
VGGWVRVRKTKKGWGQIFFPRYFLIFVVFLNSLHREAPKNAIKKIEKKSVLDFGRIFCKNFSTRFFLQNVFCGVFELPSQKKSRGKTDIEVFVDFFGKSF